MKDEPFDRKRADGFVATPVIYYAQLYPRLREVARQHGYALALHGSLQKDLDVIAVPWTEEASGEDDLVIALCERAGGFIVGSRTEKPAGRVAWTIHLGGNGGYVDLSIVPGGLK